MSILLQVTNAHKRYGAQVLLEETGFTVNDGQKIGLIGRNGSGKSTLCRVLLGQEDLDAGEIHTDPNLRLGYLEQHDPFHPGETAHDFLMRDSGQPDWRCGQVAGRFEIKGPLLDTPVQDLSGGWQTRVKLAALLLHDPNLLILDEPTNFLDLRTQLLLEHFLRDLKAACLVVSHDRAFLKATCDNTLELARGKLTHFSGPIDAFLEHKEQRRRHDEKVNQTVEAKRKQLQTFIDRYRAKARSASQAKSKAKQLARLETRHIEGEERTARIRVPSVERGRGIAVECRNLSIGYPGLTVAEDIDLEIPHGSRVVIVGDNGQGKTTLLRTLVGSLVPVDGDIDWGFGVSVGTYAQHVYEALPLGRSVLEYLEETAGPGVSTTQLKNVAGSFLFSGHDAEKKVDVLSGGERARLCLAGILLGGFNVLVMDEPGNHLDVQTVESLAEGLRDYQGTILFTSHDRHFMERVSTDVVEVRDHRVASYPGGYEGYLFRIRKEIEAGFRGEPVKPLMADKILDEKADREERKERARQRFLMAREATAAERQMDRFESRRQELESSMASEPDADRWQELNEELKLVKADLTVWEEKWLALQEKLEAFDARED